MKKNYWQRDYHQDNDDLPPQPPFLGPGDIMYTRCGTTIPTWPDVSNPSAIEHFSMFFSVEMDTAEERKNAAKEFHNEIRGAVEDHNIVPFYSHVKPLIQQYSNNKDIIMRYANIKFRYGCILQDTSEALKDDKELVLLCVKTHEMNYSYASDRLKKDVDVVEAARSHQTHS